MVDASKPAPGNTVRRGCFDEFTDDAPGGNHDPLVVKHPLGRVPGSQSRRLWQMAANRLDDGQQPGKLRMARSWAPAMQRLGMPLAFEVP